MTRAECFLKAVERYGQFAIVGTNEQYPDKPFHVGVRENFEFVMFGAGKTWDEALDAVVDVIDLGGWKFARPCPAPNCTQRAKPANGMVCDKHKGAPDGDITSWQKARLDAAVAHAKSRVTYRENR